MAAKKGGVLSPNAYNESGGTDGEPVWPVDELYTSYDQCSKMQLSQDGASMMETPNSMSGAGIMGGPVPGEPQVVGTSTTNQSKK